LVFAERMIRENSCNAFAGDGVAAIDIISIDHSRRIKATAGGEKGWCITL